MPRFDIEEAGLYNTVEVDDQNRPVKRAPLSLDHIPGEPFERTLLFRIKGDAGTFPVKIDLERPDGSVQSHTYGDVTLPPDQSRYIITPVELSGSDVPPGTYRFMLSVGGTELGGFALQF